MLTIRRVTSEDSDFIQLVKMLDQDLNVRYDKQQEAYDVYNKIESIATVVVAYLNEKSVGCGCFKKYDETTIEIKRMFVKPEMRGRGIAKKILDDLELWGMQLGFMRAILETGKNQPEAIGLYKRHGYSTIPNYDQYADMPNSVCMEKHLRISNFSAGE